MKKLLFVLLSITGFAIAAPESIVLVLTNHGEMKADDQQGEAAPTGFYLSEAAHPYAAFRSWGFAVILASPKGGFAPVDPKSLDLKDPNNASFWEAHGATEGARQGVKHTRPLAELELTKDKVAGVYFAGGHGAMWDFPNSEIVGAFISKVHANGGVIGAVCHGPAALVGVKDASGKSLVAGKKVAGFTNSEEKAVKLTKVVPFLLQDELRKAGAVMVTAADFKENAVRDGRLVTGQNPASAAKSAKLFLEAIGHFAVDPMSP